MEGTIVYVSSTEFFSAFEAIKREMRSVLWESRPVEVSKGADTGSLGTIIISEPSEVPHEEWNYLSLLMELTTRLPICVAIWDSDALISEIIDVLPAWCHGSKALDGRLFFFRGEVCLIVPTELRFLDNPESGAQLLLRSNDHRMFVNKGITRRFRTRIEKKEWEMFPPHMARVILPRQFAFFLVSAPQTISLILNYLPPDPDVNKAALKGEFARIPYVSHSVMHDCISIGVPFTRLQWAFARSLSETDVLPVFRKHTECNLIGRLILSGMCGFIKRGDVGLLRACFEEWVTDSASHNLSMVDLLNEKAFQPNEPKGLISLDEETDDSWLTDLLLQAGSESMAEEPEDNEDIAEKVKKYFEDDESSDYDISFSEESRDHDSHSGSEQELMEEVEEMFGQMTSYAAAEAGDDRFD
jgi:hypothetical protein